MVGLNASSCRALLGRYLCTGGSDASVAIVDTEELIATRYIPCDGEVNEVIISPDARWIAFSEWASPGIYIASAETGAHAERGVVWQVVLCSSCSHMRVEQRRPHSTAR